MALVRINAKASSLLGVTNADHSTVGASKDTNVLRSRKVKRANSRRYIDRKISFPLELFTILLQNMFVRCKFYLRAFAARKGTCSNEMGFMSSFHLKLYSQHPPQWQYWIYISEWDSYNLQRSRRLAKNVLIFQIELQNLLAGLHLQDMLETMYHMLDLRKKKIVIFKSAQTKSRGLCCAFSWNKSILQESTGSSVYSKHLVRSTITKKR